MQSYDGENVVQRGDIVFVSIHHRLNVLGFLDLSTVGGDQFKSSANVGMLGLSCSIEVGCKILQISAEIRLT